MRVRVRGPEGQSIIVLEPNSTVGDLRAKITESTSITQPDIKFGYPPKSLSLDLYEDGALLSELDDIKLDGEQLIVNRHVSLSESTKNVPERVVERVPEPPEIPQSSIQQPATDAQSSPFSFAGVGVAPPQPPKPVPGSRTVNRNPPLSLSRKPTSMAAEPPEVPLPTHSSTLILRIMPDDNSCLFRAFNSAFFGAMDNMNELRSVIAQTIQAQPEKYPAVVLERDPDDYCRWIQTEDAWGGFIELDILSNFFGVEICSIDVQTLRIDRFNEGSGQRCILVYSGIHYDVIAQSPSDPPFTTSHAPPDLDVKIFASGEDVVLEAAVELCTILQGRHYFTDTAAFTVRCNKCGHVCTGERGATEHAGQTGHYDFGEAS